MLFDLNKHKNLVNAIMYWLVYIACSERVSNRKVQPKTQTNGKVLGSEHFLWWYDDQAGSKGLEAMGLWCYDSDTIMLPNFVMVQTTSL